MSVIARERATVLASSASITAQPLNVGLDSSTSWIEEREARIEFLRREYDIASEAVVTYLRRNADVAWTLIGAKAALKQSFGDPVDVTLRIVRDPEEEDPAEQLFGYIRCPLPLADALDALDRFDNSWLLGHLDMVVGRLSFDLRF
jgi:hypothetical protein